MRLATYVYVTDPEGASRAFGPDDDLPDWAVAAIPNPKAWAEPPASPKAAEASDAAPDDGLSKLKLPELKAYAAEHGIDLGTATKKEDIVAAIRAKAAEASDDGDGGQPDGGDPDAGDGAGADTGTSES